MDDKANNKNTSFVDWEELDKIYPSRTEQARQEAQYVAGVIYYGLRGSSANVRFLTMFYAKSNSQ